jgi:hypothetical protein
MKRLAWLLIVLLVAVLALPATAQSTPDVTALARYYPESVPVYVGFRTDDDYFAALEAVRAHFAAALPDMAMDDDTLYDALDRLGPMTGSGETFAEAVRPWLGDSGAVGALSLDSMTGNGGDSPLLIALSITDRAGAQDFFDSLAPDQAFTIEETPAYTLFTPTNGRATGAIYIDDQVLLVTNKPDVLPVNGLPSPSLADDANFQASQSALPADSYNIAGYMDYAAMLEASMADMRAMGMGQQDAMMEAMLQPMLDAIGGFGFGLTILDGRALTADVAVNMDTSAMGPMMPDMSAFPAFDPAFAQHLPSGTQLAIQSTDLAATVEQSLNSLSMMAEMQSQMGSNAPQGDPAAMLEFALQGTTGMNADSIFSWMTGQYAVGLSVDFDALMQSAFSGDASPTALQFAFVTENTDGTSAQALVSGLSTGLTQLALMAREEGMTVTQLTLGGQPAVRLSLQSPDMREPFEITVGANEDVFVVGTPDMARAALSPDGAGLSGDAGYQESLAWVLPESPAFLYGSGDFLNTFLERMMLGGRAAGGMEQLAVGPLFSSTSGSGVYGETSVVTRLILALAQD